MDERVNVPIDDPNADTEWNDILRKHGVIPEKPPSPTPIIQEAIQEARKQAHENRLEDKDLDALHELEDEEDEAFLEKYRNQRMAELSTIATANLQGLLVDVGALKPNDYRLVSSQKIDEEEKYSSIRSSKLNRTGTNDDSDDWE
ncbi:hypothetical protein P7C71_g3819, partial [Lecanoromycetidae sp. Uapishka_2]